VALSTNLILFVVSLAVLLLSGSFFIKSLSKIASFLKISEFVVAFIVVGIATSLPELFVGINAALIGQPSITLGNIIGSNIANLTLIIGIPILIAGGMKIDSKALKKDSLYMFLISLLPLILMVIGNRLSRLDGAILIGFFLVYVYVLLKQRKGFTKEIEDHTTRWSVMRNVAIFLISGVVLFYSANYTVKYASLMSADLLLPPIFIGLFLIALGTSLPELIVGVQAVRSGHPNIALGDIIGSVVASSTLILGITALIAPITANLLIFFTSVGFMIFSAFLFLTFVESGNKLRWKQGISMILIYVLFLMVEFYVQILPV